jgi:scyllo-inositol 2-dehydrogenase (NADP+)
MSILVIGGGKMGLSHMAILNRLLPPGQVALCDSSRITRYIFEKLNFRTFKSLDEAFAQSVSWSGAVVATPTSSHFSVSQALLDRSIPCFIEKPLTLNPKKSKELIAIQQRTNTVVQVGLVLRFVQSFVKLHWIVRSKVLGAPLSYSAKMLGNVVTKPDNNSWRTDYSKGGGCLNEYGPHLLDLCRAIFGDVSTLQSATYGQRYSTRADDSITVGWKHTSGAQGNLNLDWCDSTQRKSLIAFEVKFEYGTVFANNSEILVDLANDAVLDADLREQLFAKSLPFPVNYYLRGEEYSLQLELFLERALNRKIMRASIDSDLAASLQDGWEVDKLINEIAEMGGLV